MRVSMTSKSCCLQAIYWILGTGRRGVLRFIAEKAAGCVIGGPWIYTRLSWYIWNVKNIFLSSWH